jgi:hypothetical protein
MADPLKQNARNLPDHMTPDGDVIVARIVVEVYASGAMLVGGNIGDKKWACLALDHAKDAIMGKATPRPDGTEAAIVEAKDSDLG